MTTGSRSDPNTGPAGKGNIRADCKFGLKSGNSWHSCDRRAAISAGELSRDCHAGKIRTDLRTKNWCGAAELRARIRGARIQFHGATKLARRLLSNYPAPLNDPLPFSPNDEFARLSREFGPESVRIGAVPGTQCC